VINLKILLIQPPWENLNLHIQKTVKNTQPPLGLAYIAAVLKKNNFNVSILDAQVLNISKKDSKKNIIKKSPDLVGITATTSVINNAFKTAEMIKKYLPNTKIVIGGRHASIQPNESLKKPYIDFVIRGEGEYTFLELVKELEKKKPKYSRIDGLSFKLNKRIIHNKDRKLIINIDEVPIPARDLLPMDKYHPTPANHRREPATTIITTRGCPFNCIFCSTSLGKIVRAHSPEYIVNEIECLIKNYKIKEVIFLDDTFTFNKKRVIDLCNLLIKKKLDLTWSCMTRSETMDLELAKKMKEAGCQYVGFGIESVTPKILATLNRGCPIETINKSIKICKKAGLFVRGFYLIGSPGETIKTIKRNIKHAKKMGLDLASFSIICPYPGTKLMEYAEKNNLLYTKNWSYYDSGQPIMKLHNLSRKDLIYWYEKSFQKFFLRPNYIIKQIFKIRTKQDFLKYTSTFTALCKREYKKSFNYLKNKKRKWINKLVKIG
jgi:radical SAM superfamily enzyme YgiQ (UPF0313 family)